MLRFLPALLLSLLPTLAHAQADLHIARRPVALAFDGGLGAPTGFFGATLGYTLPETLWALEAGGGLGSTGWQATLQAKHFTPLGRSRTAYLTAQLGPSLGMIGKPVGTVVPAGEGVVVDDDKVYWVLWLHAGVGFEARWAWGGLLRMSLGAMLNAADTQADLCPKGSDGDPGTSDCAGGHVASGPQVARAATVLPWLGFAYGWSF